MDDLAEQPGWRVWLLLQQVAGLMNCLVKMDQAQGGPQVLCTYAVSGDESLQASCKGYCLEPLGSPVRTMHLLFNFTEAKNFIWQCWWRTRYFNFSCHFLGPGGKFRFVLHGIQNNSNTLQLPRNFMAFSLPCSRFHPAVLYIYWQFWGSLFFFSGNNGLCSTRVSIYWSKSSLLILIPHNVNIWVRDVVYWNTLGDFPRYWVLTGCKAVWSQRLHTSLSKQNLNCVGYPLPWLAQV